MVVSHGCLCGLPSEELPARDQRADHVYLDEVGRCDIYLGIFGNEYGYEDRSGVSPTEREYDHATKHGKTRLIYVWGAGEKQRAPKMRKLVRKASSELIRRRIEDESALTAEVYASLVDHLDRSGALRVPPFDRSGCDGASLADLSRKRIDWFLQRARRERGFPLAVNTATEALLAHLKLLDDHRPTNAAVLLFGTHPQQFHRASCTWDGSRPSGSTVYLGRIAGIAGPSRRPARRRSGRERGSFFRGMGHEALHVREIGLTPNQRGRFVPSCSAFSRSRLAR